MGKITLEHKFDKGDKVIVSKNYYDTGDNNFKGRIGSIQNITISYFSFVFFTKYLPSILNTNTDNS